jgi:hypothetical protein
MAIKKPGFLKCKGKSKKPGNIQITMERKNRNTATNDVGSQRRIAHIFHGIDHHAILPSAEKNALPQKRQDRSAASRWC